MLLTSAFAMSNSFLPGVRLGRCVQSAGRHDLLVEVHQFEHEQIAVGLHCRQMLPGTDDDLRNAHFSRLHEHRCGAAQ